MEQNVRLMKKIFPLEFSIFNIQYNSLIIIVNGIFSQWKKIFYSLFLLLKNISIVIFSSCRRLCTKFNRKYYFKVKKKYNLL